MIKIHTKKFSEKTAGFCDIIDITAKVREHIEQEKIERGLVTLFVSGSEGKQACGSCHTLLDAGTAGTVGPNLDQALGYSCAQGFEESTAYSLVLGQIELAQGAMPANLVTGQDAVDVAAYVASVAGKDVPGCDPSGDQGGAATTETSG